MTSFGQAPAATDPPLAPPVSPAFASSPYGAAPMDWPMWRGPEQNGISRETGLVEKWSPKGENLLWSRKDMGTRSTPIILRGKLYTLVRDQPFTPHENEKCVCVDAATGQTLWENHWNVYLSDVPDTRVGWSSVVGDPATGIVYALGVNGYFSAMDGETGKTLWAHSLSEEYGLLSTYGGRTNFPIVFDDLVIISAVMTGWGDFAKPVHRFVAFAKKTGEAIWLSGTSPLPDDTTYSTPILATFAGQPALVFGAGDGILYAMQPRTGKIIWQYQIALRGMNVSPLVDGHTVYMGQSEENEPENNLMGCLVAVDGTAKGEVTKSHIKWRHLEIMVGKSSPLLVDGRLYAIDDSGVLYVLVANTGKVLIGPKAGKQIKLGTAMRASPLYADGKIYVVDANGNYYVLKPTADGVEVTTRVRRLGGEGYASPIVSHGRLYITTTEAMYCIGTKEAPPRATPRPPAPQEAEVADHPEPAQLLVMPAETLVHPGDKVPYQTWLFNALGQRLANSAAPGAVRFTLGPGASPAVPPKGATSPAAMGPKPATKPENSPAPPRATPVLPPAGTIAADGLFTAYAPTSGESASSSEQDAAHRAATITVKAGQLTGTARVRVLPPLPWKFTFDQGEVPVTWVGARYRHVVRQLPDGNSVMVKVTTIPKGTRSQCWLGTVGLHDYTIQAEVKASSREGRVPDMGLIAQRYTLDMMGAQQQLQIRTWVPTLRAAQTVPFSWQPEVWYNLKLRAEADGDKAILRGKAWPKGTPEPETWSVEAVDETPNLIGSPGLFGNATNAEVMIDNLTVTANEPLPPAK